MKKLKAIEDYDFPKREYQRRKHLIMFLGGVCDQFLHEANKLKPVAENFSKMQDGEKRRYSEAITAISVWLENMRDLAYGEDEPERIDE